MTTEAIDIKSLENAVSEAQFELDTAQLGAATKVAEIMAVQPIDFIALGAASTPVTSATAKLERAKNALNSGRASDRWEQSVNLRHPILDALKTLVVDADIVSPIIGLTGHIVVVEGKVEVKLSPQFAPTNMSEIESLVAGTVDAPGLVKAEISNLIVKISGLDKENPVISLLPANQGEKRATTKSAATSTGTRSGAKEYIYKGQVMGPKEFLTEVENDGAAIVADHAKSFETVLRGTGNGLSNLAVTIAKKMNVESREKVVSA